MDRQELEKLLRLLETLEDPEGVLFDRIEELTEKQNETLSRIELQASATVQDAVLRLEQLLKVQKGEKGDPGRAFTYEDFTEEQLEALRGPEGNTPEIDLEALVREVDIDIPTTEDIVLDMEQLEGNERLSYDALKDKPDISRLQSDLDRTRQLSEEAIKQSQMYGGGNSATFLKNLRDVDLNGLQDNYILKWDQATGKWRPEVDSGGETNTASNVGGGAGVFKQKNGADFEFRTLTGSSGVSITEEADEVDISVSLSSFDTGDLAEGSNLYFTDERAQDAVGSILTDSAEIDFTYDDAGNSITAALVTGSIDETKLDTSVNASLDLADSASQPGHTHTKSDLTDIADFLLESEVDIDIKTLTLPASTTISSFGASLVDDADAAAARTTLGLGTIATLNSIDISTNTNLAVSAPITLTGDTIGIDQSALDHGTISGLSDDDHTQYALLAGRGGGQELIGGTDASDNLMLKSTSNATKGKIQFGNSGINVFNETNEYWGFGIASPEVPIHIVGEDADPGFNSMFVQRYADAAQGVGINFDKARGTFASPTDVLEADTAGVIRVQGWVNGGFQVLSNFQTKARGVTATGANGWVRLLVSNQGSNFEMLSARSEIGLEFNRQSRDLDFQVRGQTLSHMLFLDASSATENVALLASSAPNWQSMDRGVFVGAASTLPTGNPADGAFLYVDDVSAGNAAFSVRNENGSSGFVCLSDGTTGGGTSAGLGNQYVEMNINGTVYKVLHDGTV